MAKLSPKEERFVEEFLVDLNATKAYQRSHRGAAYNTARTEGSRLLANPDIQIAIENAKAARSKRTAVTQDKVLKELARIGFSDIRKFVEWGYEAGALYSTVKLRDSDKLGPGARAISEVSNTSNGVKIKLHSKVRALELLGRHTGLFKEDENPEDRPTANFAELAAKAKAAKRSAK